MSLEPFSDSPSGDNIEPGRPRLGPLLSLLIVLAGVIAMVAILIVYGLIGTP